MVRIIIVDDDRDTVEVFSEFLRLRGHDIVGTGYDGKEAVDLYRELKPDIIILDMKMPEYDGKYAIDEIKKVDPAAKIIVVTGFSEYKLEDLNINALFHKPYEIDEILKAINKIIIQN